MKHSLYIIIGVTLLLFVSCGQQQRAKSIAKDFMESTLKKDVSYIDFSNVDSTRVISDSLIQVRRSHGIPGIGYQERKGPSLLHIRAKYVLDGDTCSTTFYIDPELTGVVAYKDN